MSIIYVSHDLNSLKLLCNRVILLNHGEVAKDGNPEDVINSYNFLISKLNDVEEKMTIKNLENSSYGTFDVEIKGVTIKGINSNSDIISSGEVANIEVRIFSKIDIQDMTVGILIRDRFGQDIFGTNTFHYNMKIDFEKNKEYKGTFSMPLNIGAGKYSISSAIHSEDHHLDNCSHWLDHACNFEIAGNIGNYFVGLSKLEPNIKVIEVRYEN